MALVELVRRRSTRLVLLNASPAPGPSATRFATAWTPTSHRIDASKYSSFLSGLEQRRAGILRRLQW